MQTIAFRLATGDRNYGEVYLPDAFTGKLPVMIHCHGGGMGAYGNLGGSRALMRDVGLARGMASVMFDCFAAGKTGGDYGKMTYARWVQNLSDVIDWLAAQDYVDATRVCVVGYSCGSTVALRAAADYPEKLRCVCCIATCATVHIGMWGQGGAAKCLVDNLDALLAGERRALFGVEFEKEFFLDDVSNAPVHALLEQKVACPVLFLQGLQDNAFRCADARLAHDLMRRKGLPGTLIEYPEGGHGLDEDGVAEQATADFYAWLEEIEY
ncbi:MAG: alpha/beta fold hydrolase [Oscillospiraceae bacterium]|nr:alpha/beta fold hydrolase [Oscillospiraceae bacterium]